MLGYLIVHSFTPFTNVLWVWYLIKAKYPNARTKEHRAHGRRFMHFMSEVFVCKQCSTYVRKQFFFSNWVSVPYNSPYNSLLHKHTEHTMSEDKLVDVSNDL